MTKEERNKKKGAWKIAVMIGFIGALITIITTIIAVLYFTTYFLYIELAVFIVSLALIYKLVNTSNEAIAENTGFVSSWPHNTLTNGMPSGVIEKVILPTTGEVYVGNTINGYIWVSYTTSSNNTPVQAQVAAFAAKAT